MCCHDSAEKIVHVHGYENTVFKPYNGITHQSHPYNINQRTMTVSNHNNLQRWFRILQLTVFAWIVIRFLMHLRDILSLRGAQKHKQRMLFVGRDVQEVYAHCGRCNVFNTGKSKHLVVRRVTGTVQG